MRKGEARKEGEDMRAEEGMMLVWMIEQTARYILSPSGKIVGRGCTTLLVLCFALSSMLCSWVLLLLRVSAQPCVSQRPCDLTHSHSPNYWILLAEK